MLLLTHQFISSLKTHFIRKLLKPRFSIDTGKHAPPSLEAVPVLAATTTEGCHHLSRGLRPPLGIYNVSVGRLCDKVSRLCERLEHFFEAKPTQEKMSANEDLLQEVMDYLELTFYAAAEHVDDIDSIASGFFPNSALRDRNQSYKALSKSLKARKRFLSSVANFIKHQQARLRLFSLEFAHGGHQMMLYGYFIEGVANGEVGPNSTFHTQQEVFSITTLAWEAITFLLECSRDLADFIREVGNPFVGPVRIGNDPMSRPTIAAAKLPLYTFGEVHPFERCTLVLVHSDEHPESIESKLYGSISKRWQLSGDATFGQFSSYFSGDGVTKTFRFVSPKTVKLQHWQAA